MRWNPGAAPRLALGWAVALLCAAACVRAQLPEPLATLQNGAPKFPARVRGRRRTRARRRPLTRLGAAQFKAKFLADFPYAQYERPMLCVLQYDYEGRRTREDWYSAYREPPQRVFTGIKLFREVRQRRGVRGAA